MLWKSIIKNENNNKKQDNNIMIENVKQSSLIDFMDKVDEVRIYGNEKHSGKELRNDMNIYIAKAMRHLSKVLDGQYIDKDSGFPHTAHVGANLVILNDLIIKKPDPKANDEAIINLFYDFANGYILDHYVLLNQVKKICK